MIEEEIEDKSGKSKVIYKKIDEYEDYLEFMKKNLRTFQEEKTSYTRKIKEGKLSIIFNKEGDSDFSILSLINKAKNDSLKFLNKKGLPSFDKDGIGWFNLTERPPITAISKVDIRGAYWNFAMQEGIVSEKTNEYLEKVFNKSEKMKEARLKALGSLATKKEVTQWVNGEIYGFPEIKFNEETRNLYIYICNGIDSLMKRVAGEIPGAFYYYWDCIFTSEESTKDVIEFIQSQKYHVKTQHSSMDVVTIGNHKWLLTKDDNKMYLVKPEQLHLIKDLENKTLLKEVFFSQNKQDEMIKNNIAKPPVVPQFLQKFMPR
jgi:hypothetical protein